MKIATWNLQDRGERVSLKELIASLFIDDADLIVLTGYQDANIIQTLLNNAGLKYSAVSDPSSAGNQILVASRTPVSPTARNSDFLEQNFWLEVDLPVQSLTLLCVYIANTTNVQEKEAFWQKILGYARDRASDQVIMMGNFCISGQASGTIFSFKQHFQSLSVLGWKDTWRYLHPITYEYKWFSNAKKGLRLDFIILSPSLKKRLMNAYRAQYPPGKYLPGKKHWLSGISVLIVELEKLSE